MIVCDHLITRQNYLKVTVQAYMALILQECKVVHLIKQVASIDLVHGS